MTLPEQPSDAWLERQLKNVPIPSSLLARIQAIPAVETDLEVADLDRRLLDVALPDGLCERLRRIADYTRPRKWNASVAAAAALLLAIGLSYGGVAVSVVGAAYLRTERVSDGSVTLLAERTVVEFEDEGLPIPTTPELVILPTLIPGPSVTVSAPVLAEFTPAGKLLPAEGEPGSSDRSGDPSGSRSRDALRMALAHSPALWQPTLATDPGPWRDVSRVLGDAVDASSDHLPELEKLPRQIPQGLEPPLQRGWDRLFYFAHNVQPAVSLDWRMWQNAALRTCPVPISTETSSVGLVQRSLREGSLPPPRTICVEDFLAWLEYETPAKQDEPLSVRIQSGPSPFVSRAQPSGGGGPLASLVQVLVQARELPDGLRPACRLTVLLDCSGSMRRGGRLEMARLALDRLIRQLGPGDRLNLVTFQEEAQVRFSEGRKDDQENLSQALHDLTAAGSTNIAAGLRAAYREALAHESDDGRRHRVVLITDGLGRLHLNVFDALVQGLRESAAAGVTFRAINLGDDTVVDPQLVRFAEAGRGAQGPARLSHAGTEQQLSSALWEALTGRSQLVAEDVELTVEFSPGAVQSYRLLGHEATDPLTHGGPVKGSLRSGQTATALFEVQLKPGASGPLATARVRYVLPWQQQSEELVRTLDARDVQTLFSQTPIEFQRAAVAAELAEVLRRSYFVQESSLAAVAQLARQVRAETNGLERFSELLDLLERARSLSARP